MLAMRVAQPMRVSSGGLNLRLPTSYDYETLTPGWTIERFGLAPRGREIDVETVYGQPLAGGWVTLNGYWRRQPYNIAAFPNDLGAAIRFSTGF